MKLKVHTHKTANIDQKQQQGKKYFHCERRSKFKHVLFLSARINHEVHYPASYPFSSQIIHQLKIVGNMDFNLIDVCVCVMCL